MSSVFIDGFVNPYNNTPRGKREDTGGDYYMEDEFCFYENETDDCVIVYPEETGRPDLISYRVYNNPLFDWVILRRNCLLYSDEVQTGMQLYIPRFSNVIGNGSPLVP